MGNYTINAEMVKSILVAGMANLVNNQQEVNDLNVFPVPDGDTGLNMSMTIRGGVNLIKDKNYSSVSELVKEYIHGVLVSARGNSGVILSQIFKGIETILSDVDIITIPDIKKAMEKGVEYAYGAVDHPVEGTILTVYHEAVDYVIENVSDSDSFEQLLTKHIEQASRTLAKTIDMLPQLKEAGVIDSGGAGYLKIVEGMYKGLTGEEIKVEVEDNEPQHVVDFSSFTRDMVMSYGYCTELIIRLQTSKVDVDNFDINIVKDFLKEQGGDSIVAYKDEDIVKVHVHTLTPGVMLNGLQKYGEFLAVKIENMTLQHEETIKEVKKEEKNIGTVIVGNGDGLVNLFYELGADAVVNGGQTGNPSSGDFLKAFEKVNAKNIIVLPNNGNIILAAQQAAEMYDKANVVVIPTKTIQQGYCALSVVVPDGEVDCIVDDIKMVIDNVVSYEITYAIRDAVLNGVEVKKDQYMCISGKTLLAADDDKVETAMKSIALCEDIKYREIITVFYGKDLVEEEKQRLKNEIETKYPNLELVEYQGDQDVYCFLISVE